MSNFNDLQKKHRAMLGRAVERPSDEFIQEIEAFIETARNAAKSITDIHDREQLRADLRFWAAYLYDHVGTYPNTTLEGNVIQRESVKPAPRFPAIIWAIPVVLVLCLILAGGGFFAARNAFFTGETPTQIPTTDGPSTAEPADSDGDGLTDEEENSLNTDPNNPDSDGDGLSDAEEVEGSTDPLNPDTDEDGLSDGDEKRQGTNPNANDTDGDTLTDGDEVAQGTSPTNVDTDGDGQNDNVDPDPGALPTFTPLPTNTPRPAATNTPVPPVPTATTNPGSSSEAPFKRSVAIAELDAMEVLCSAGEMEVVVMNLDSTDTTGFIAIRPSGSSQILAGQTINADRPGATFDFRELSGESSSYVLIQIEHPELTFQQVILEYAEECPTDSNRLQFTIEGSNSLLKEQPPDNPNLSLDWSLITWGPSPDGESWVAKMQLQAEGGDKNFVFWSGFALGELESRPDNIIVVEGEPCKPAHLLLAVTSAGEVVYRELILQVPCQR